MSAQDDIRAEARAAGETLDRLQEMLTRPIGGVPLTEADKEAILGQTIRRAQAIAEEMGMSAPLTLHCDEPPAIIQGRVPVQTIVGCRCDHHDLLEVYDVAGVHLIVSSRADESRASECYRHEHPCPLWKAPK